MEFFRGGKFVTDSFQKLSHFVVGRNKILFVQDLNTQRSSDFSAEFETKVLNKVSDVGNQEARSVHSEIDHRHHVFLQLIFGQ